MTKRIKDSYKKKYDDFISRNSSHENPDKLTPAFVFENVHNDYCLSGVENNLKSIFAEKLLKIGKNTWREINASSRMKNGSEIIPRDQIRPTIPDSIPEDANILSFHVKDKYRILGYRKSREFHIIFIDCDGKCYSHD